MPRVDIALWSPSQLMGKHVRSLGKIYAAACFYLHMWVPTHLWEIELTNKRQHAQHCWAELITFTIRIVSSGFVDIHHSQMAESVVAHMQTVPCPDVAHQTERSLNMASGTWSSDKENSNATQRRKIIFFGIPPCHSGCSRIRQRAQGWKSNIPHPLRLWHIGYVFTQLRISHHAVVCLVLTVDWMLLVQMTHS